MKISKKLTQRQTQRKMSSKVKKVAKIENHFRDKEDLQNEKKIIANILISDAVWD